MIIMPTNNLEDVRPPSQDERRAMWAMRYFLHGFHRNPHKPRIRIPVTVPAPLSPRESVRAAPSGQDGAFPSPRAAAVTDSGLHSHTLAGDPAEESA